jgi:hypothetical protein
VLLGDTGANIADNGIPVTLTNVNNTISGFGTIGGSNLALVNSGTIIAAGGSPLKPLTISTGANTIINAGQLEGGIFSVLVIDGNVTNSKTVEALGAGATVSVAGTISNTPSGLILASGIAAQVRFDGPVILPAR